MLSETPLFDPNLVKLTVSGGGVRRGPFESCTMHFDKEYKTNHFSLVVCVLFLSRLLDRRKKKKLNKYFETL